MPAGLALHLAKEKTCQCLRHKLPHPRQQLNRQVSREEADMFAVNHNAILMPLFFLSGFWIGHFLPEEPQTAPHNEASLGTVKPNSVASGLTVRSIADCLAPSQRVADYLAITQQNNITFTDAASPSLLKSDSNIKSYGHIDTTPRVAFMPMAQFENIPKSVGKTVKANMSFH